MKKTEERHENECETRKTMSSNKLRKEHEQKIFDRTIYLKQ